MSLAVMAVCKMDNPVTFTPDTNGIYKTLSYAMFQFLTVISY